MMDPADVERFAESVARLADSVEQLQRLQNTGNQSVNTVSVGDRGVMAAIIACAVVVGLNLGLVAHLMAQGREITELREQTNVTKTLLHGIWQQAPHLRPTDQEDRSDE